MQKYIKSSKNNKHVLSYFIYSLLSLILVYISSLYFLILEGRLDFIMWIMGKSSLNFSCWPFFATIFSIFLIYNLAKIFYGGGLKFEFISSVNKKMLALIGILILFLLLRFTPLLAIFDSGYFDLSKILNSKEIILFVLSLSLAVLGSCYLVKTKIIPFIKSSKLWIILLLIIGAFFYILNSILPYLNFQAPALDVGLFNQVIWNFSRFHEPTSTIRGVLHIWADHFHPILLLLSPLYWFTKGPVPILVVQALVAASGALPIYLIVRKKTKNIFLSFAAAFSYLFFVGLQNALNFGFYPENMGPALFSWAFFFLLEGKVTRYFIFLLLWLATKEDVSIFVSFFGIYIFFFEKNVKNYKILGIITLLIGLVWYKLATGVIIPHYADQFFDWAKTSTSKFMYFNYDQLGSSPLEVIKNGIKNPFYVFYIFTHPEIKIFTELKIIFSYGGIFVFSPLALVSLPMFLEAFLANRQTLWEFHLHYQGLYSAILAIASALAVARIAGKYPKFADKIYISGGLLIIFSIVFSNFMLNSPLLSLRNYSFNSIEKNREIKMILNRIPSNAAVTAQNTLAPYLSQRDKIYLYPRIEDSQYLVLAPSLSKYPIEDNEYKIKLCNLISQKNDFQLVDYNAQVLLFEKGASSDKIYSGNLNENDIKDLTNKYCAN